MKHFIENNYHYWLSTSEITENLVAPHNVPVNVEYSHKLQKFRNSIHC